MPCQAHTRNKTSPIYDHNIFEGQRLPLKEFIREYLQKLATELFSNIRTIDDENIFKLINDFRDKVHNEFQNILHQNEFRYGVAQKIINLFLKYLWTADFIPKPPHAPYDGIINTKLESISKKFKLTSWTELKTRTEYEEFVLAAKEVSGGDIATWELDVWNKSLRVD